ncbi:MAG: SCO family protein [Pseudolabrys sp.]
MTASDTSPPSAAPASPGWLRALRTAALAGLLLLAGFIAGIYVERARSGLPKLADLGPAPQYTLTNQLGQTVSSKRFAGKVQVVTFLFPYCTTYCPLIAAHLMGRTRWRSCRSTSRPAPWGRNRCANSSINTAGIRRTRTGSS